MPIEVWEAAESPQYKKNVSKPESSTARAVWHVRGTEDPDEAADAVADAAESSIGITVLDDIDLRHGKWNEWTAEVSYVSPERQEEKEPAETDSEELSFDTTGGTTHITHGELVTYYSAEGGSPDFEGGIHVTDGGVEGTDIIIPALRFVITKYVPANEVTNAWIKDLSRLTGRYNSTGFRSFDPGEVLFMGCKGERRKGKGDWRIGFEFDASQNIVEGDNFAIGPINVTEKLGWNYLWVHYEIVESPNEEPFLVHRPHTVYIVETYKPGDFSITGLSGVDPPPEPDP